MKTRRPDKVKKGTRKNKPAGAPKVRTVFKVSEAAAELGVSEQHILNAIEAGEIGAIDAGIGSRHFWRIPVEELERFKKARNTLAPGGSR